MCVCVYCCQKMLCTSLSIFVVFTYWQSCNSPNLTTALLFNFNLSHAGSSYHYVVCDGEKEVNTFYCPREILLFSFCLWSFFVKIISFSFWHGLFEDLSIRNSVTKGGGISSLIGFPVDLSTFWQVCARQRSVVISLTPAGAMVRGANLKIGVNFWKREFFL